MFISSDGVYIVKELRGQGWITLPTGGIYEREGWDLVGWLRLGDW